MIGYEEHLSAMVEPMDHHSDASICQMLRVMLEVKKVEVLAKGHISVHFVSPLNNKQFGVFVQKLQDHARVIKKTLNETSRS